MSSHSQLHLSHNTKTTLNSIQIPPLTFNDISKYFHLPLSDAASAIGTCSSVLREICHENGLDSWPCRKILSGKNVEDVKRRASREKNRKLARLSNVGKQSGLALQKNLSKTQCITPHHSLQKQISKGAENLQAQSWLDTSLKGEKVLDEFKYGCPSEGLSVVSNRWWGCCSSDDKERISRQGADLGGEKEHTAENAEDGISSAARDGEEAETEKEKIHTISKGTGLLTEVREKIVKEGQEALKLGVYRGSGVHKLSRKEGKLLFQLFGSPLRNQWLDGLS